MGSMIDEKMRSCYGSYGTTSRFSFLGTMLFPSRDQPEYVNTHVTECLHLKIYTWGREKLDPGVEVKVMLR